MASVTPPPAIVDKKVRMLSSDFHMCVRHTHTHHTSMACQIY